jgi:pyridoxal 5'-phosphate synthase pdxT subunit
MCDALIIPGGESTTIALLARLSGLLEPLREFVRDPTKATWGTCAGAILLAEKVINVKKGGQETLGGITVEIERNGWGSQVCYIPSVLLDVGELCGMRETLSPLSVELYRANADSFSFLQVESFEAPLFVEGIREASRPFKGVFIRAPVIRSILPTPPASPTSQPIPPIEVVARIPADLLPYDPNTRNDDDPTDPTDDRTIVALRQGRKFLTTFHPELTLDGRFHEYFLTDCVLQPKAQ